MLDSHLVLCYYWDLHVASGRVLAKIAPTLQKKSELLNDGMNNGERYIFGAEQLCSYTVYETVAAESSVNNESMVKTADLLQSVDSGPALTVTTSNSQASVDTHHRQQQQQPAAGLLLF